VKSRYLKAVDKFKNSRLQRTLQTHRRQNKRLRPTSACSSPTKMGHDYENIEVFKPEGGNIGLGEEEVGLSDFTNSSQIRKVRGD
jgi:hypothetical protein